VLEPAPGRPPQLPCHPPRLPGRPPQLPGRQPRLPADPAPAPPRAGPRVRRSFQVHDTYYYFVHRLLHAHRGLYTLIHSHHHSVEAELSARTGLFISGLEAVLLIGIPGAVMRSIEACTIHNELGARIAVMTQTQINVIGHIGGRAGRGGRGSLRAGCPRRLRRSGAPVPRASIAHVAPPSFPTSPRQAARSATP
jgi:hypothetical protein